MISSIAAADRTSVDAKNNGTNLVIGNKSEQSENSIWQDNTLESGKYDKSKPDSGGVFITKDGTYCKEYINDDGSSYIEETKYNPDDFLDLIFMKTLNPEKTTKYYTKDNFLSEEVTEDIDYHKITQYNKDGSYRVIEQNDFTEIFGIRFVENDFEVKEYDKNGHLTQLAGFKGVKPKITRYNQDGSYSIQENNTLVRYDKNDNKVGEYEVENVKVIE